MRKGTAAALPFILSAAVLILAARLMAAYVGLSLETYTGIIGCVLVGYSLSRDELLKPLRREGPARGVAQMVLDDRYCLDVLTRISAVRSTFEAAATGLVDDHVRTAWPRPSSRVVRTDERLTAATVAIPRRLKS